MEKWTLQSIGSILSAHMARDEDRDKKTDAMYKILVTGNGIPSLSECVRNHETWINDQKTEAVDKKNRVHNYTSGIVLLVLGQLVTLAVAIWK